MNVLRIFLQIDTYRKYQKQFVLTDWNTSARICSNVRCILEISRTVWPIWLELWKIYVPIKHTRGLNIIQNCWEFSEKPRRIALFHVFVKYHFLFVLLSRRGSFVASQNPTSEYWIFVNIFDFHMQLGFLKKSLYVCSVRSTTRDLSIFVSIRFGPDKIRLILLFLFQSLFFFSKNSRILLKIARIIHYYYSTQMTYSLWYCFTGNANT